jgi:hypothetical protein
MPLPSTERILLGPGPSLIAPRVMRAMAAPVLSHLDPDFVPLLDDVRLSLRRLFKADDQALTIATSGTGTSAMEAAVANSVSEGTRAVVVVSGYFGDRLVQIMERYGARVRRIEVEWGRAVDPALVRLSGNHMSGPTGFVAQLDAFEPYRGDPLRKKSYVLVQDLIREGTVVFEDEASLEPAIDYHVMRLYLRTGRVVPVFNVVSEALKGKPVHRPRLVQKLREAVAEALKLTASYAELTVAAVNYVEWQLGRTVCDVRRPGCVRTTRQDGLDPDIARLFEGNCPFQRFCNAKDDPEWRRLREPNLPTTFY